MSSHVTRCGACAGQYINNELAESYRFDHVDKTFNLPSGKEGEAVFLPVSTIRDMMNQQPAQFSEWFKAEIHEVNWFEGHAPQGMDLSGGVSK